MIGSFGPEQLGIMDGQVSARHRANEFLAEDDARKYSTGYKLGQNDRVIRTANGVPVDQPNHGSRGEKVNSPARKDDGGKLPIMQGALGRFPRAIAAVAEISQFGAQKYGTYDGWETVENAFTRYRDAMHRHEIARLRGERVDPESGLMHLAHFAWGALATLELALREEEKGK